MLKAKQKLLIWPEVRTRGETVVHEYYYGGAVALLLQDHLTMSVTEQSQYLSATVQREHKTCPGVNPQGNTP